MYTKEDIIAGLKAVGVNPEGTLLVHSSMKSLGEVDGGAQTVLDALSEYMSGGLLVLPTHSWRTINDEHNLFDYRSEPSCVGILSNLFMKRPGVIRSLHPTHSVAAFGADAESYVADEINMTTPCGIGGCWHKLLTRNAQVLFLGCGVACNTFLHGVEEWNDVPYRLDGGGHIMKTVMRDGSVTERNMRRHHSPNAEGGEVSQHYSKVMPYFV